MGNFNFAIKCDLMSGHFICYMAIKVKDDKKIKTFYDFWM